MQEPNFCQYGYMFCMNLDYVNDYVLMKDVKEKLKNLLKISK